MSVRLLQISDCHLFTDSATLLRGIATWSRFEQLVAELPHVAPTPDLLLVTGDTAHDELLTTYQAAVKQLAPWESRLRIIPGNHDDRESILATFPNGCRLVQDRLNFAVQFERWQVVGLDTHLPGSTSGRLGREQLDWLSSHLNATRESWTVLAMHHPPLLVQSPWLDAIGLEDRDDFAAIVRAHGHVRLILCGHIHQAYTGSLGHATVLTTPAVGPQFRPRTEKLEIIDLPPAYRLLDLQDSGQWSSQVMLACK